MLLLVPHLQVVLAMVVPQLGRPGSRVNEANDLTSSTHWLSLPDLFHEMLQIVSERARGKKKEPQDHKITSTPRGMHLSKGVVVRA